MKKLLTLAAVIILGGTTLMNAGRINRALSFTPQGQLDCGAMPTLDNLDSYSVQFWINPAEWTPGAGILSRGDDFRITLGEPGTLVISTKDKSINVPSPDFKDGEWTQVTLICEEGNALVLVNSAEAASGELSSLSETLAPLTLGGGFNGMLDEVRIWNAPLDGNMRKFDYFTNNTLNKWCPMWDNLTAYYKMDQADCPEVVEYKALINGEGDYNNHGVMSEGISRVDVKNPKMPYLINSAYTSNDRFYNCIIPRDQYLLSNEIIILGTDVFAEDGRIETKTPNNHALSVSEVKYLPQFEGRDGVVAFDNNSKKGIIAPSKVLALDSTFTFSSWVYVDEWQPESYILRKENDEKTAGLAIYLDGSEENPAIGIRINGNEIKAVPENPFNGQWFQIAMTRTPEGQTPLYINGTSLYVPELEDIMVFDESVSDHPVYIGEGFVGKMDDTIFWNKAWSDKEIATFTDSDMIPMPGLDRDTRREDMHAVSAFYRYDNPENLGYSFHSQDEWLEIMKKAYEGIDDVKFYISVQGTYRLREKYGDWREILCDPVKRKKFAEDLAMIARNYDGAELDLEWIENDEEWENFGILAQEIRETLPEDKEFRISLHNNYTAFPKDKMKYVDVFTFQQYGPNPKNFEYSNFEAKVDEFLSKYDRDKIMTSYACTTSRGLDGAPVNVVKNGILAQYVPGDDDVDSYTRNDTTWKYIGPMQVYRRAKHTREQDLAGIFYWDMGDDYWLGDSANPVMPEFNSAKYSSYGINANNDPVVKSVNVKHYKK